MSKSSVGGFTFSQGSSRAGKRAAPETAPADAAPSPSKRAKVAEAKTEHKGGYPHVAVESIERPAAGPQLERLHTLMRNICDAHVTALSSASGEKASVLAAVAADVCKSFCDGLMDVLIEEEGSTKGRVVTNPKNTENAARLETLKKQQSAYADELKQWQELAKKYEDGDAASAEDPDADEELDTELLQRFLPATAVEAEAAEAMSDALLHLDSISDGLRATHRLMNAAHQGVKAASSEARASMFPGISGSAGDAGKAALRSLTSRSEAGSATPHMVAAPTPVDSLKSPSKPSSRRKSVARTGDRTPTAGSESLSRSARKAR